MRPAPLFLLLAVVACSGPTAVERGTWTPDLLSADSEVYLPDYSYAGYRWGEAPLPSPQGTVIRAVDHGVVPDDGQDDTAVLRRAVAAASGVEGWVVVELPAGEVELRNLLFIERGDFVLRGAGSGEGGTTLSIPVPMREMDQPAMMADLNEYLAANDKRAPNGEFFTPYSWTGGVVWTRVPEGTPAASHAPVAGAASGTRGAHTFYGRDRRLAPRGRRRPPRVVQPRRCGRPTPPAPLRHGRRAGRRAALGVARPTARDAGGHSRGHRRPDGHGPRAAPARPPVGVERRAGDRDAAGERRH